MLKSTFWPEFSISLDSELNYDMSKNIALYDNDGRRLYLSASEREKFLETAEKSSRDIRTFCSVLAHTGCRISEALALTPKRFDFSDKTIIIETLKKRRTGVYRAVPVPPVLLDQLEMAYNLRDPKVRQKAETVERLIWPWSRIKGWYEVKAIMDLAGIAEGPHKCPKGLRHAYGIHALNSNVPLNLLSKWMGHASMETTAIYANAVGEEQQTIASRMWS